MVNILTIDIEDYFMVSAFEGVVKREDWDKYESRIERNTHRLLDILNGSIHNLQSAIRNPVRATFFCLGWVAERYPHLIKEIHKQGHEIACHSYDHRLVYSMTPGQFREDIKKSKKILEDLVGQEVIGYRAPSYSITRKSLWAVNILAEEGYWYDSSIFPIHHDRYGIPDAPRHPFLINLNGGKDLWVSATDDLDRQSYLIHSLVHPPELCDSSHSSLAGSERCNDFQRNAAEKAILPFCLKEFKERFLIEIPISTKRLGTSNIPIAGGGYFRLIPYPIFKKCINSINEKEKRPFLFYLHPWEIDPEQPRLPNAPILSKFRHYLNLNQTEKKFLILLRNFNFSSIKEILKSNSFSPVAH